MLAWPRANNSSCAGQGGYMGKGANLEEVGLFFFFFFLFFSFPYLVLAALPTSLNLRMAAVVGLDVTPGVTDAGGGTGHVTAGLQSSPRRPRERERVRAASCPGHSQLFLLLRTRASCPHAGPRGSQLGPPVARGRHVPAVPDLWLSPFSSSLL